MKERLVPVSMAVLLLMVALAACGPAPVSVEETEVVPSTASPSDQEVELMTSNPGWRALAKGRIIFHKGSVET